MIVQHDQTPGKSGAFAAAHLDRSEARTDTSPQGFFKADRSLVFDEGLSTTEKILLMAIGCFDWGDGRGGWPSNATLVKACGLKTTGRDGGQAALRKLLRGLKAKGRIKVDVIPRTRANPTGRVLRLTPKTTGHADPERGNDPDLQDRVERPRPGHTGPVDPDIQDRVNPDLQILRIDPDSTDSGTNPSSGDDDSAPLPGENSEYPHAVEKLRKQARRTFKDRARADRVIEAIGGWLALVEGKCPDPATTIGFAIAGASKARPGGEVGYIARTIQNAIDKPTSAARAVRPAPKDATEIIRKRAAAARVVESQSSMLEDRWYRLDEPQREVIEGTISPIFRKAPAIFRAMCYEEMDRRHAPS